MYPVDSPVHCKTIVECSDATFVPWYHHNRIFELPNEINKDLWESGVRIGPIVKFVQLGCVSIRLE